MAQFASFSRKYPRVPSHPYFHHDYRCNDNDKKQHCEDSSLSYDTTLGFVTTKDLYSVNSYRVTLYGSGRFEVDEVFAILRKNMKHVDSSFYHVSIIKQMS